MERMFPWNWYWTLPSIHLPFSGAVAQQIAPDTTWFFDAISPSAGNASVEKRAFELASYGRQLGLITEVVLRLAEPDSISEEQFKESFERLKEIHKQIDDLKREEVIPNSATLVDQLVWLRAHDPIGLKEVLRLAGAPGST
ncbi:hypothetical protein LMG28727_07679 [Paraburkholderia kirstenboschensis]|nr:hypothetical protein LMG28727_07679 [Paraburkholderia kirstenboschensis]